MDQFINTCTEIFDRDIQLTINELEKYKSDDDIWTLPSGINNPAGTLGLHLAGNLQHFVGTILGGSDYKRDRPNEFAARDVPRLEVIAELKKAKLLVRETLESLDPATLKEDYPASWYDKPVSNYFILTHLIGHLNYHLGQINYHRRLLTK